MVNFSFEIQSFPWKTIRKCFVFLLWEDCIREEISLVALALVRGTSPLMVMILLLV